MVALPQSAAKIPDRMASEVRNPTFVNPSSSEPTPAYKKKHSGRQHTDANITTSEPSLLLQEPENHHVKVPPSEKQTRYRLISLPATFIIPCFVYSCLMLM
mmetsp:Transcript_2594/g.4600  ORF Transcript_2594/g.4600 Transcript_2594/m.4600 type:complete len:101 (+) Transcript_2594:422-724(+)